MLQPEEVKTEPVRRASNAKPPVNTKPESKSNNLIALDDFLGDFRSTHVYSSMEEVRDGGNDKERKFPLIVT